MYNIKLKRCRLDTYSILNEPYIMNLMADFIKNQGKGFYMKNN